MPSRRRNLFWLSLLLVSLAVLIWRFVDYADEARLEFFHMTRSGLSISGNTAEVLQLLIILITLGLFCWAGVKLARLAVANKKK